MHVTGALDLQGIPHNCIISLGCMRQAYMQHVLKGDLCGTHMYIYIYMYICIYTLFGGTPVDKQPAPGLYYATNGVLPRLMQGCYRPIIPLSF